VEPDRGDVVERLDAGVLWLVLNRPEVGNALTPEQRDALVARFEAASADPSVRAVVLAAEGRHFCTGADLSASSGRGGAGTGPLVEPGSVARTLRTGSQRLTAAILDCEKPVVAEVHGAAAGIGAQLALAADFAVAADDTRLIQVFARRGLVPDGGAAYLLTRLVGPHTAKRLLLLADDVGAEEAVALGLVHRVVPLAALRAATEELVGRLAVGPTRTYALTKWLVNRSIDSARDQAFADEAMAQEQNMATADAKEGLAAFGERRDPRFVGR
jgi:2-(1,2-epoxy-1,2-dihydrophenyl)acetyl-CoA isomerase